MKLGKSLAKIVIVVWVKNSKSAVDRETHEPRTDGVKQYGARWQPQAARLELVEKVAA